MMFLFFSNLKFFYSSSKISLLSLTYNISVLLVGDWVLKCTDEANKKALFESAISVLQLY